MDKLWGIDLGGTKTEGVIIESVENPEIIFRKRIPTESGKGYEHILDRIFELVKMISTNTGIKPKKIGFGTPGVLDPRTHTMKNCNTTCLNGRPLKNDLEKILGIPCVIANDANCFALAEAVIGAVKEKVPGARIIFGVIMGTGVGGGIVVDGKALYGCQGIAGEWGHNFLDSSGGPCYCGKTGCVETIISGPALQNYYKSLTNNNISLDEIVNRHKSQKDKNASLTIERLLEYFGKAMANVINILDPDVIVLGGGLGNIDLLYNEGIECIKKHVFNNRLETVFLKPKLGDSAGVFGAALLVL